MVHNNPSLQITLFYMDIQNFGKDFSRYYEEANSRMRLIRGLPGDFYDAEDDRISLSFYDEKSGKTIAEDFDMVVLSVGMTPSLSNPFFTESLGCSTNRDGFLSLSQTVKNSGIVLAGAVEGPMDVSESITHAKRAAREMHKLLMTSSGT
jgi:heterodisulfide reductase subunit A